MIRKDQPRIGTQKLMYMINDASKITGIRVGRDSLYKILRNNGLLVRIPKKNRPKTTDGNGRSLYPDLRKEIVPNGRNQLWSTDITYLRLDNNEGFSYAVFIIDEWSHKIVGHCVSETMEAIEVVKALEQAIRSEGPRFESLIHHSDRGSQFRSGLYLNALKEHDIQASMTENGSAYENPVSERLNGIIKNELLEGGTFSSFKDAKEQVKRAVMIYNEKRPHYSCGLLTPKEAHQTDGPLEPLWRRKKASKISS